MKNIVGKKGGSSGKAYNPVEDKNSLRSNSVARIVDVISEGEIEGFVASDKDKSIYIDQIPLKGDDGYNFNGITTVLKEGLPDQIHIPGFSAESEQAVGIKLTYNVPTTKTITNTNVDECIVTVRVPALMEQKDNGDIKKTSVKFRIEINNNSIGDKTIHGKCTSEYLKSYRLPLLENFGAGPWEIKLTRLTADSSSPKLANDLYWNTYTELINEKIPYNDTALVAFTADAQQFGGRMPQRLYHIKGIKVKIPSNYDPETREYDGVWDGTFKIGYTNNPAWIYYDLLYSERYGCGFEKDIGDGNYFIDKWELYTIAQNCDVLVDDGKGGTEPRFTFNSVINTREQAQVVLTSLASTFRAKPFWYTGLATLSQDRPKDPVKVVTNADVIDGIFQYSGSSLKDRVTCVNVSWNDPDDFYKPAVEVIEDQDGIARYGFNSIDIAAYGCTSRAQARRFGKWYLYTELQQTTTVEYSASFDHFQLIPGDIIIVNDEHYITKKLGGRIKSATTTEVVLDRNVTLESGKTYTIAMEGLQGQLVRADILNSPETTDTLSISTIISDNVPQNWAVFSINSDSFDERHFQIVDMRFNKDNIVNIKALLYNANKFDAVDTGIYFDEKHYSDVEEGALLPPTNLSAEEYTYADGQNNLFGVLLSWGHPDDARINRYEIQSKTETGAWKNEGVTEQNSYTIKPVEGDNYYFRVRSVSISSFSTWVTTSLFTVYADPDALSAVTNLKTINGDGGATDEFDGKDCEIVWEYDIEDRFKEYFIEVYNGTTLKRSVVTVDTNFIYTYDMNLEDNTTPIRSIGFKVYVRDVYNKLSASADIVCSNPIPSMASATLTITNLFKGLKITWSSVSDNDMDKYKIYLDKSNPPTTEIAEVGANTNSWIEVELDSDDTYYVQIEPYDCFGVGTKSQVANGEPLVLPHDGIDLELSSTIEISDSAGRTPTQLSILYDGDKISNSLTYNPSNWIEYKFPVEYIIDNMTVWVTNSSGKIYVGYKRGEADSWHYLKAESDHTLDSDGRLLSASSESDANDNYLNITAGINRALFPQALVATHCRLFFSSHQTISTNIYELRFIREVIAEQIIADNLSSISANVGAIEAGTIQSQNYDNTHGMLLDLNGDAFKCGGNTDPKLHWNGPANELNIKAKVTFESGTTGYENTDGPQNLSELDSTADNKLSGIDEGADVTSNTHQIFRMVSRGNSSRSHPREAALLNEVGTVLKAGDRSYNVSVLDRASRTWDSHITYDVYGASDTKNVLDVNGGQGTGTIPNAIVNFTPVDCTGLTKANGTLIIDLKCSDWSKLNGDSQLEISSSNSSDVNEWWIGLGSNNPITWRWKTFNFPLSEFTTTGGEVDVTDIKRIRWYAVFSGSETIYWRNAKIHYGASNGSRAMADALYALDSSKIVAIFTYDEPYSNRLESNLDTQMYRCGASKTIYGSSNFKIRSAYCLLGIPDIGQGNGLELYSGDVDNDVDAWIETTFIVDTSGNVALNSVGARDAVDLSYSDGTTVEDLKPAAAGADKTSENTAANIAGQGDLATQNRTNLDFEDGADETYYNTAKNIKYQGDLATEDYVDYRYDVTNAPTELSDINSTEGNKLSGIENGADVTANNTAKNTAKVGTVEAARVAGWGHTTDTTKINGGKIYTSSITADGLDAGCVIADKIYGGAVTADKIDTGAVTADKINVNNLAAIKADMGSITSGNITLDNDGFIKSEGKDGFDDTTPGFWLGYESSDYTFAVGDNDKGMKWDGSVLEVNAIMTGQAVGNKIIISLNSLVTVSSSASWTKIKEFVCGRKGSVRVYFKFFRSGYVDSSKYAYARIYKNGSAIGITRSKNVNGSAQAYSEDFSGIVAGDKIQMYVHSDGAVSPVFANIQNFQMRCNNPIQSSISYP